jgi:hypothetical protein
VKLLLEFALTMICLVCLAGMFLWFHDIRAGFEDQWRELPQGYVRTGLITIVLAAALLLTEATLLVVEPWGHNTAVYVVVAGGASLMLLALAAGAVQAVQRARRLKQAGAADT